ncbi:MAG: hypothetical protein ACOX5R_22825 [bacterium]|jgi:hypothetical protein
MEFIIALISGLIGVVITSLISALFLMLSSKIVLGYAPGYGLAFKISFLANIAAWIVTIVFSFALAVDILGLVSLVVWIITFLIYAALISKYFTEQTHLTVSFGKACLVALVQMIIVTVLMLILGFLILIPIGLLVL